MIGSVLIVDSSAHAAPFRGVAWIDEHDGNASHARLVSDKGSKLRERPIVKLCPVLASGLNTRAYTLEFLKSHGCVQALRLANERLRNAMVCVFLKPGLFPGKLLETAFCRLRPLSLQARLAPGELGSYTLNIGPGVAGSITVKRQIHNAKIDAKHVFNANLFRVRHVTDASKIPLALNAHQIDLALTVGEQGALAFAADEGNLDAARERPDRNGVTAHKAKNPVIVRLGRVLSKTTLALPVELVGVGNLGNAADRGLGGKLEAFPAFRIGQLMQRELLKLGGFPSLCGKPIASLIATFKRLAKSLFLLSRWQQLDVCNQLHGSYIEPFELNFKCKQLKKGRKFLPGLKAEVSFAQRG